jgi:soluble lytic murein transglycosylase-like protein
MLSNTGRDSALRQRALAGKHLPQGPSQSLLLAIVPGVLFVLVVLCAIRAWATIQPRLIPILNGTSVALVSSPPAGLSPAFTPQVLRWSSQILDWSSATGLDPNLIATVMQIESCGDPMARSPSGALGLFQVMSYHFAPGEDPFNPETNARRGLAYLAAGLDLASGETTQALAGYNGGNGLIGRTPASGWPAETRRYVHWGAGLLDDIASGRVPSPTLNRWLNSGGASLCRQGKLADTDIFAKP